MCDVRCTKRRRRLLTRFKRSDKVKTWGLMLAKRSCHRKARVAVARKLAVIMHAMWMRRHLLCRRCGCEATETSLRARR